eukprot:TCALIF_07964-PA protein Name:"Similar to Tango11 Transport and Golgi organization protein 11 (Drosophila melanogaster)" AED:0.10 eAED:0.10 QI:0/0/0/0.5/1/1/2/0/322
MNNQKACLWWVFLLLPLPSPSEAHYPAPSGQAEVRPITQVKLETDPLVRADLPLLSSSLVFWFWAFMSDPSGPSAADLYNDARFTADISTRMRVPDRIVMSGESSPTHSTASGFSSGSTGHTGKLNDLGMARRDPRLDMQVPDRILLAGGHAHIASKSTPRELQLERAFLPPTSEQVRVSTPPRSIRLDEHAFPSAAEEDAYSNSTLEGPEDYFQSHRNAGGYPRPSQSSPLSEAGQNLKEAHALALMSDTLPDSFQAQQLPNHLSPGQEMQMLRRQLAKLNHRLMAVELENQQQQQREMILTVLVSVYFIGKVVMWVNRSL